MSPSGRAALKHSLGRFPWVPETLQGLRPHDTPTGGYRLDRLAEHLPVWLKAVQSANCVKDFTKRRRILTVGSLPWWVEHVIATGLLLQSQGHEVDIAYVPYRRWAEASLAFDIRRQQRLLEISLAPLRSAVGLIDLSRAPTSVLDPELEDSLEAQAAVDVQYTLQREDLDYEGEGRAARLFRLRLARDRQAAAAVLHLLETGSYDVVVLPNGSILEFGAAYRTAKHVGTRVVTYEFGEQRQRVWLDQDGEVMRLNTRAMWEAWRGVPLAEAEMDRMEDLYRARRGGRRWHNFARQWQVGESLEAEALRREIGLAPEQKLVLLCTNVVGDSLALDRQVFTHGMTDWLQETVRHLARREDCKLVVRVHPGELLGAGHPSTEIVRTALPIADDSVVVIPPDSSINTYDLMGLAHVGLVYTTTVGMEMAMRGIPVVAAGDTHYRGKGFTVDPTSMDEYLVALDELIADPPERRLSAQQVELARRYAYRFFFEYPFPFPWHIVSFWEDMDARPLEGIVQQSSGDDYRRTLEILAGAPIGWRQGEAATATESVP